MSTWVSDWHTFSLPVLHKLHEEKKMLVMLTQDCTTTRQNANTNRGALNCKKKLDTFGHHKCPPFRTPQTASWGRVCGCSASAFMRKHAMFDTTSHQHGKFYPQPAASLFGQCPKIISSLLSQRKLAGAKKVWRRRKLLYGSCYTCRMRSK